MTPREIIANTEYDAAPGLRVMVGHAWADAILSALTAAGYRLVAPGEMDRETVEMCAKVVESRVPATQDMTSTFIGDALEEAATALRALVEPKP